MAIFSVQHPFINHRGNTRWAGEEYDSCGVKSRAEGFYSMGRLDPRIQAARPPALKGSMDCRVKPGNDEENHPPP
jgi:hypothetical protein